MEFIRGFEDRLGRILEQRPAGRPKKLETELCGMKDLFDVE